MSRPPADARRSELHKNRRDADGGTVALDHQQARLGDVIEETLNVIRRGRWCNRGRRGRAEVAELEAAVPRDETAGDRYAPANMKAIDR